MWYVPKELVKAWETQDPLDRFEAFLEEEGHATAGSLRSVREEIGPVLDAAAQAALESPFPAPGEALLDVYCETE